MLPRNRSSEVIENGFLFIPIIMKKTDNKNIRKVIFEKYNGHCAYCGIKLNKLNFTIDHIEPKFRKCLDKELLIYKRERGKDSIDNYNPSCKSCNSSKSTFTIEKWKQEILLKYNRSLNESSNLRLLERFGMIKYNPDLIFYFEKHPLNR